jgi:hypothetical protein
VFIWEFPRVSNRAQPPCSPLPMTPRLLNGNRRRSNAVHVYRLEAFRSRGRGHARAASNGLLTHGILPAKSTTAAAAPCPHFAALVAAPSPTAAARSSCPPRLMTAAPRRCYGRMAFRPHKWSTSSALGSRLRTASAQPAHGCRPQRTHDGGRPRADHRDGTAGTRGARLTFGRQRAVLAVPGPELLL